MALSREEVLDAIADMSVMDVVQLVEAMEEKFGVSAAAAVAAAPAAAARLPLASTLPMKYLVMDVEKYSRPW